MWSDQNRKREPRAVTILKHSLRKLIKEANEQTGPRWGKSLRGKSAKSSAAEKARRYLACIKNERPAARRLPTSLWSVVHDLRLSADNLYNDAAVRIKDLEKLLRIAGYSCAKHHGDEIDALIDREMGLSEPEPEPETGSKAVFKRKENRGRALLDIKAALAEDIAAGGVTTLAEAIEHLRLPEMPAREVQAKPTVSTIDPELRARMDRVLGR